MRVGFVPIAIDRHLVEEKTSKKTIFLSVCKLLFLRTALVVLWCTTVRNASGVLHPIDGVMGL
jgi:hypothetical protein